MKYYPSKGSIPPLVVRTVLIDRLPLNFSGLDLCFECLMENLNELAVTMSFPRLFFWQKASNTDVRVNCSNRS